MTEHDWGVLCFMALFVGIAVLWIRAEQRRAAKGHRPTGAPPVDVGPPVGVGTAVITPSRGGTAARPPASPDTAYYHGVIAALVTERLEAQRALTESQVGDTEREEAHEQEIQRWKTALARLRQAQDAPRVVALRVVRERVTREPGTLGCFVGESVELVPRHAVLAILDAEIGADAEAPSPTTADDLRAAVEAACAWLDRRSERYHPDEASGILIAVAKIREALASPVSLPDVGAMGIGHD